jgi:Uncharacterized protein conserved in bacteria
MSEDDDLIGGKDLTSEEGSNSGNVAANHLRSFVERIERLEEEKPRHRGGPERGLSTPKPKGLGSTPRLCGRSSRSGNRTRTTLPSSSRYLDLYRHALGMI